MTANPLIAQFLATLPPVQFAAAYGSGVFMQKGYTGKESPMIDIILGVADAAEWHRANLAQNAHHYSSALKWLGADAIGAIQDTFSARLWFNTLVPVVVSLPGGATGTQLFKYGVISLEHLQDDLRNWRNLYVSGRLQKPVALVTAPALIREAMAVNLRHSLTAALLTLPQRFTSHQLFLAIAGLSYTGDFRMIVGENPKKVSNIVTANMAGFSHLYTPSLQELAQGVPLHLSSGSCVSASHPEAIQAALESPNCALQQSGTGAAQSHLLSTLPAWLRADMSRRFLQLPSHSFAPEGASFEAKLWRSARNPAGPNALAHYFSSLPAQASSSVCSSLLLPALASVVSRYSRTQAIKGILTAGAAKSATYSSQKLVKMFQGTR